MFQFSDDFDEEDFLNVSVDRELHRVRSCTKIQKKANDVDEYSGNSLLDLDDDDLISSVLENVDPNLTINKSIPSEKINPAFFRKDFLPPEWDSENIISTQSEFPVPKTFNISWNKHRSASVTPGSSPFKPKSAKLECEQIILGLNQSTSKVEYERKFPGPAGLILKNKFRKSLSPEIVLNKDKLLLQVRAPQTNDSLLENRPWQELLKDVNSKSNKLLKVINEYTAAAVKRKNIIENTSRKIPLFAAVICHIDFSLLDPMITLKDPSGEVRGTVRKDVWEEYNHLLVVGNALLLRQVSLLSFPNSRKLYLNITSDAMDSIYYLDKGGKEVGVQKVAPAEILQNLLDEYDNKKHTAEATVVSQTVENFRIKSPVLHVVKSSVSEIDNSKVNINQSIQAAVKDISIIQNELEGLDVDSIFGDF